MQLLLASPQPPVDLPKADATELTLNWEVGDLISTGTPPGVGVFRKPPVFMQAGDTVSVETERIGTLTNRVVASR